jgi:small glutamine-rich tetratricopeptide repeat-containing protein alpha
MSSVTNKDIALTIIGFLKTAVSNKEIGEDYAESMDVAIDCIADAFEVDKDDESIKAKFGGKDLKSLLASSAVSTSSVKEDAAAGVAADSKPAEVDDATKAKADGLKVEGNRAMAARNFDEAIAKYTEAIELDSSNVVYLSNRAAAYSSSQQHDKAVTDAEAAIKLNPDFSKAYSRLGLAKYALGDAKAAMEAYKKGLDVEGDKKSDAMVKGYETAKKRVEEDLEQSISKSDATESGSSSSAGAGAGAGAGGLPDLSSLFGSGGGMPNLADMMSNPQIMQAAQQMMSDPSAMQNLLSNPAVRQMAQNFGLGGENGPDLSSIMNNPMFSQFMGGNKENPEN